MIQVAGQNPVNPYAKILPADSRLISGDFYAEPSLANASGHPYFLDTEWKRGYVILDGIRYDNLQLRYNIVTGQLLLNLMELTGANIQISLKTQCISEFGIDGHRFVPTSSRMDNKTVWFREILAQGPATLAVFWTKSLKVPASGTSTYVYESRNHWTLITGETSRPYRGLRTLSKLYPSVSKDLAEFKRSMARPVRKDKRARETALVKQCNSLLQAQK
jgi:hypothetical protein